MNRNVSSSRAASSSSSPARPSTPTLVPTPLREIASKLSLFRAITIAIREQTLPVVDDLATPIIQSLQGPPPPLVLQPPSAVARADSRFIEVLGVRLHYVDYMPTSTPPRATIVLLHGFNGSTISFRDVTPALAQRGYRAISFDRPPFGLTERPVITMGKSVTSPPPSFNPYTTDGAADLCLELVRSLSVRGPIILVGHSAGAGVALSAFRRAVSRGIQTTPPPPSSSSLSPSSLSPPYIAALGFMSPALPADESASPLSRADFGQLLRFAIVRTLLSSDNIALRYVRQQIQRRARDIRAGKPGEIDLYDVDKVTPDLIEGYLLPLQTTGWDIGTLEQLRAFTSGGAGSLSSAGWTYDQLAVPILMIQGRYDKTTPTDQVRLLAVRLATRAGLGGFAGDARRALDLSLQEAFGGGGSVAMWDGQRDKTDMARRTRYVELDATGHLPSDERPEEVVKAIDGFLDDVVPRASTTTTEPTAPRDGNKSGMVPMRIMLDRVAKPKKGKKKKDGWRWPWTKPPSDPTSS